MKENKNKLKCPPILKRFLLKKENGVVLIVTLLLMLGIAVIGMGVVINANFNASIAKNYVGKLQSFYAADAQVAVLAQEVYDGNADKYLGTAGCSGGGNVLQNCDFASDIQYWRAWHGPGFWDNGQFHHTINDSGSGGDIENSDITQSGLTFVKGTTYQVSFKARSSVPNKFVEVRCQHDGDYGGTGNYFIYNSYNQDFCLGTTMQVIALYWSMDTAFDNHDRVSFKCGGQGIFDLWFDDIAIAPVNNTSANLARGKTTSSKSDASGHVSTNAVDANVTTYWSSSSADDQWITVDLSQPCLINTVLLKWTADYATKYEILVSSDQSTWHQVNQNFNGDGGSDLITFPPQLARYVQMHGILRATSNGFSLYEFEVYGSAGGRTNSDTTYIGGDSVAWNLQEVIPKLGFNIASNAYMKFATGKTTFNSQLSQYVELPLTGQANPPFGSIIKVPVTYYDFHSDRTNPEFEQPYPSPAVVVKHLVADLLDGEGKPQAGTNCMHSKYVSRWFRPYSYYTGNHKQIPKYSTPTTWQQTLNACDCGYPIDYVKDTTVTYDTAFINVEINDSLSFTHIGNGMYEFTNPKFFPLDNRGFGKEWYVGSAVPPSHNFSYTMKMNTTFNKVSGQKFYFVGDDDVWLYIDNALVMDLGGVHPAATDSVNLDNLTGLVNNNPYHFDFFYCERHSYAADIKITTNILLYQSFTHQRVQWKRSYGNID
jgi:fibro-slime domain-containing protein